MNVPVIQAMPNSAIPATMPALNTDMEGTCFTSGRPRKRIATPTANITITMVAVMSSVTVLSSTV